MKVAVINAGSSSLKVKVYDMTQEKLLNSYLVEHIAQEGGVATHKEALESLGIEFDTIDMIGHRVVHGGEYFHSSVEIDDEVIQKIEKLNPLAPLHNPANLEGIKLTRKKAPYIKQIAVFDTAFHTTMPKEAYLYALDYKLYEKHNIRRYGFHGISHAYLLEQSAKALQKDKNKLNIITLHLGNGASACAIENGKSIDTSMGFTPLEGLVMGTRSGDIDPAIVLYMQRELGYSVDDVDKELNKHSGLLGIAKSNDLREITEKNSEEGRLAIKMMLRRIQKYIGAYLALLGDVDAVILSAGIGENSTLVQEKIKEFKILKDKKILIIPTDEELQIAKECLGFKEALVN
jgi:acetate kinase